MSGLVRDVPKPMVALAGKPIMEYQIDLARRYGLAEIHVLTGYKAEVLEEYFGDGSRWGVGRSSVTPPEPLRCGTAAGSASLYRGILLR